MSNNIIESRTLEISTDDHTIKLEALVTNDTVNSEFIAVCIEPIRKTDTRNIIYWDNIDWFISRKKKQIDEECKEELEEAGYPYEGTGKIIKKLIKRAKELYWL